MIGPDSRPRARIGLAEVEIDGEIVLYDDGDRRLHRLNPAAATLWRCLDGTGSLAEIAEDIAEVYGQAPADILDALVETTGQLTAEGLIDP